MIKIIQLCQVCGGKSRFFTEKCPSCKGQGGNILKLNKLIKESIETNKAKFSDQENKLLELYISGFSQEEIAIKLDISLAKLFLLFYRIEKKLNS
jgi:DNA-binding NarL/FixJ family response regulator